MSWNGSTRYFPNTGQKRPVFASTDHDMGSMPNTAYASKQYSSSENRRGSGGPPEPGARGGSSALFRKITPPSRNNPSSSSNEPEEAFFGGRSPPWSDFGAAVARRHSTTIRATDSRPLKATPVEAAPARTTRGLKDKKSAASTGASARAFRAQLAVTPHPASTCARGYRGKPNRGRGAPSVEELNTSFFSTQSSAGTPAALLSAGGSSEADCTDGFWSKKEGSFKGQKRKLQARNMVLSYLEERRGSGLLLRDAHYWGSEIVLDLLFPPMEPFPLDSSPARCVDQLVRGI